MKRILIFACLIVLFIGCRKDNIDYYSDEPGVYFPDDRSMELSFSKYSSDTVTLLIPIEIGGYPARHSRKMDLRILADSTTAKEGVHFKIMINELVFPADSLRMHLAVRFYNNDPALRDEKVRLHLRIVPNDQFPSPFFNQQDLEIYISDILLKPKLWDAVYSGFFGTYSEAKHRKILELCDIPEIPDVYDGGPFHYRWDAYGRAVNNYYKENYPQYDEHNQVIEPWM